MTTTEHADAQKLLDCFKQHLKQVGMTYRQLAERSGMAEVTIKRLLNRPRVSLDQLLVLCRHAGISLGDLSMMAQQAQSTSVIETDQARVFAERPALLEVYVQVILGLRTLERVQAHFSLNAASAYLYVRALEKMGLISLRGEHIALCEPLRTAIPADQEAGSRYLEDFLAGLGKYIKDKPPAEHKDRHILLSTLLLTDRQYSTLVNELEAIYETCAQQTLQHIHHPNPKARVRTLFAALLHKDLTPTYEVSNLVD